MATNPVPNTVARGIVRLGLSTLPAGTVADSSPKNAHSVRAQVAKIAVILLSSLVLTSAKLAG